MNLSWFTVSCSIMKMKHWQCIVNISCSDTQLCGHCLTLLHCICSVVCWCWSLLSRLPASALGIYIIITSKTWQSPMMAVANLVLSIKKNNILCPKPFDYMNGLIQSWYAFIPLLCTAKRDKLR